MSEELLQRDLLERPEKLGDWLFYNIGSTTINQLKKAGVIPKHQYGNLGLKKPDALVVSPNANVIACIEYKQPSELNTDNKVKAAIDQEIEVAKALRASVLIVTDGKERTIWVNPYTGHQIKDERNKAVNTVFVPESEEVVLLLNRIVDCIDVECDQLKNPSPVDPLPLAREVWQDLWVVSGASAENCLYTFVEIFIFKYLSDLGLLKGLYSFEELIKEYGTNTDEEVLEHYATTIRKKIKELFPKNEKDGTTIINGTIFVSKDDKAVEGYAATFKGILKKFDDFGDLSNIDRDFKSKLFETFLKQSISKKNWGQYFTPLAVVKAIIEMADIEPGMNICDPACGVGKFLLEAVADKIEKVYKVQKGKVSPQIRLIGFDKGFDKDEQKTIILAKANMLIYLSGLIKQYPGSAHEFAELFNETFLLQTNSILGTLAHPINREFDLILTNPPYVMSGSGNLKGEIRKSTLLENHYIANGVGIEGLFLEWIVRALKERGDAFIVVPDGVMSRKNDSELRKFIRDNCTINAIISLPINTFYSTNKKTYILSLTKKEQVSINGVICRETQDAPVFAYLCSEIGETRDVYRFPIDQNDLSDAAALYNAFKGAKTTFSTSNPRCKLLSIEDLSKRDDWCVDRWWSDEEKVELGIKDPSMKLSVEEFSSSMQGVIESLTELREVLDELVDDEREDITWTAETLGSSEYFEIVTRSTGLNKTQLHDLDTKDGGDIPVYSAQRTPIAHIKQLDSKKPIEASPENRVLSFATNGDGSAGRNFVMHDSPFYISRDRIGILVKDESILPDYVLLQIRDMKEKYGFSHSHKANSTNIKKVEVLLPVNDDGAFDRDHQEKAIRKASVIEEMQYSSTESEELFDAQLSFDSVASRFDYAIIEMPLTDLFEAERGPSKFTKSYGQANSGPYPVWAASPKGPLTHIDEFEYEGRYLSWATNGFAGKLKILDGRFSINGDRGVLIPKRGRGDLSLDYFRYVLEPIFRKLARGRKGDNGENEYTKLSPESLSDVFVPVPASPEGMPDLIAQREMAKHYLAFGDVQTQAVAELDEVAKKAVLTV